jgi:hypothetical protein
MMKNRHPLASYLVPTTHLGDETLYTQNGSHAQSFPEQLSASFSSFEFDVIFFGISEGGDFGGAGPTYFWALFLAFGRFRQGLSARLTASTIKILDIRSKFAHLVMHSGES